MSDVTNQGCKKTFHNVKTNKISTVACPPGTALIATTVTESQAEAQHESFVVALPPHVSDARKQQFRLQIQQLMREKRSQLQANIVEQTPCYDGGETMQIASGVNTGGDSIGDLVEYGLSPDCTRVLLDYASLSGWSIPNALYWGVSKYAGQQWGENCTFIGNGTVTHTYDANEPAGYDFVFYLLDQGQGSGDGGGLVCEGDDNSPIFGLGPLD